MSPKQVIIDKIPTDKYSRKILEDLNIPKTISEISQSCNIPIATVYRRVRILSSLNFLEASGDIVDGVRFFKYKRNTDFNYINGKPRMKKILDIIRKNPGLCFTELMKQSGYASGTLSYSISNLVKDNKLIRKRSERRTWFFSPEIPSNQMSLIVHLRKETCKNILLFLSVTPLATFKQIRTFVKKSPPTVSLTLTHLIDISLVKRIPGIHPHYELIDKDLVLDVLNKMDPSLLDTFKDRFADTFSYL